MEGAPPARQRALNTRGGLGGPWGSTPPSSSLRARPSWLKGPLWYSGIARFDPWVLDRGVSPPAYIRRKG